MFFSKNTSIYRTLPYLKGTDIPPMPSLQRNMYLLLHYPQCLHRCHLRSCHCLSCHYLSFRYRKNHHRHHRWMNYHYLPAAALAQGLLPESLPPEDCCRLMVPAIWVRSARFAMVMVLA